MDSGIEFTLSIMALIFVAGIILMAVEEPFKRARETVSDMPQPARFVCSMMGMLIETIVFVSIGIAMLAVVLSIGR